MKVRYQIGIDENNIPVFYFPSESSNQSESVFIYGKDEKIKDDVISLIMKKSIKIEKSIWIIFCKNIGQNFIIDNLKIPIKYTTGKAMMEFFDWEEMDKCIYDLSLNKFKKRSTRNLQILDSIIKETCKEFSSNQSYTKISPCIDLLTTDEYSDFGRCLIKSIQSQSSHIISLSYINDKIMGLLSFIIDEIRSILNFAKLKSKEIKNPICFLCDQSQIISRSLLIRNSLHDIVFCWGRTLKISRYIIERNDKISITSILRDGVDFDGSYSMVMQCNDGKINYVNRIQSTQNMGKNDVWNNVKLITS